jgi:hypothetical protein
MNGDYCWALHREIQETSRNRKGNMAASPAREKDSARPLNKI